MGAESEEQIWMQFTLDWTTCQIHQVSDDQPLEIILNGTIESDYPEVWTLSTVQPTPGAPPNLHFVEDVTGRTGQAYGNDTTLEWALSLADGPFEPMTILPDNSLTFTFPPGKHSFQVRIRGDMQTYQADGYYRLQLNQSFAPQL